MKDRLDAETKGETNFALPAGMEDNIGDAEIMAIYHRQSAELKARRSKLMDEEKVLKREIAGLRENISGYQSQAKAAQERLSLFQKELADKRDLLNRQLIRRTEVFAVQRAEAGIAGELASLQARAADAQERVSRAEHQIAQLHSSALKSTLEELRAAETELDDIHEQIRAARDVLERVEVRAPVRGIVVRLHQNTQGGVVGAGAVIMELLPTNDDLIIEARVNPSEISHVKYGLDALVRLSSLNQRLTPMIEGKVVYLSADAISQSTHNNSSEDRNRDSFVVRIQLDEQDTRNKLENFRPTPGMPADVFIRTGERTFFEYIMKPVSDSFARAFREH
jgi:HlyD family secretion protein